MTDDLSKTAALGAAALRSGKFARKAPTTDVAPTLLIEKRAT